MIPRPYLLFLGETKDDLAMHGFKYGFSPIAVSRNLSVKDAEDYGRKGREFISNYSRFSHRIRILGSILT